MNQSEIRCHALLPAAGIGSRMGSELPKQYLRIAGATLLEHSLKALLSCDAIQTVVVALHPDDRWAGELGLQEDHRVRLVEGGAERSDSVLAAIESLLADVDDEDWVLVHDAARPCLRAADLERLMERVCTLETGGLLAQPVVDTVKLAGEGGLVAETLDRSRLWRAQTPQMFRLGELHRALKAAGERGLEVTDEASAMELAGHPVQLVPGSSSNLKVTVPDDLPLAEWYLGRL